MKTQFILKHITLTDEVMATITEKCQKLHKVTQEHARVECRVEGELPNNTCSVSLSCIEPEQAWIGEAVEETVVAATDVALDNLMREIRRSKNKDRKLARERGRDLKNQVKNIT